MACVAGTIFLGCLCDGTVNPPPPPPPGGTPVGTFNLFRFILYRHGFNRFLQFFYAGEYDPDGRAWVDGGPSFAKNSVVRRYPKGDSRCHMYIALRNIDWVEPPVWPPVPPDPLPPDYVVPPRPADPNDPGRGSVTGWGVFGPKVGANGDGFLDSKDDFLVCEDRWHGVRVEGSIAVAGGQTASYSFTARMDPWTGAISTDKPKGNLPGVPLPNGPNGEPGGETASWDMLLAWPGLINADNWSLGRDSLTIVSTFQSRWYTDIPNNIFHTIAVTISVVVNLVEPYTIRECFDLALGALREQYPQFPWYIIIERDNGPQVGQSVRPDGVSLNAATVVSATGPWCTKRWRSVGSVRTLAGCANGARDVWPNWEDATGGISVAINGGLCPP